MEKAKLTKAQAEALEDAHAYFQDYNEMIECHTGESWSKDLHQPLLKLSNDEFCRAIYVGYEIIEEDQTIVVTAQTQKEIRELFASPSGNKAFEDGFLLGVARTLQLTGIKVKGINDDKED